MSELLSCGSGQDYSDVRVTVLLRGDKLSEFSTTALYHSQSGALHVGEHQTWHPQNQTLPVRKWSLHLGPQRSEVQSFVVTDCLFRLGPSHIPQPGTNCPCGTWASWHPCAPCRAWELLSPCLSFDLTPTPISGCPRKGPEPA